MGHRWGDGVVKPLSAQAHLLAAARQALSSGQFEQAEAYCQKALEENPEHPGALLLLGTIFARTAHIEAGIEVLQKFIAIEPTSVEGLNWLAALLREKGKFAEATALCERAVLANPADAESFNNLGMCLRAQIEFVKAAEAFRRAVLLRPSVQLYCQNLIGALLRAGLEAEAESEILAELARRPFQPILQAQRIRIQRKQHRSKEADEFWRHSFDSNPDPNARLTLAKALLELGEKHHAEATLRRLLELGQAKAEATSVLAEILQNSGRFEEANEALVCAIELDPNAALPYFDLIHRNKVTPARLPLLARMDAMASEEGRPRGDRRILHYALGKAHDDLGKYMTAIRHFDEGNRFAFEHFSRTNPFNSSTLKAHVDQQINVFTPEFFERHRSRQIGNPSELPLVIVGMMRSGTTLMRQILSSHPQIAPGSEIRFWAESDRRCLEPDMLSLNAERVRALSAEYLALLAAIDPTAPRVTDKMPHNYLVLGRIHAVFPNARIIHCRRNPVDTCLSIWFTAFQHSMGYTHNRENIVFAYREYQRLMSHWRQVLPPDRFLEIDYETVVQDYEREVRRIVDFCGIEWDDKCLRHFENRASVDTASIWQVRQPIYDSSVDRWRNYQPWLGAFAELDERLMAA